MLSFSPAAFLPYFCILSGTFACHPSFSRPTAGHFIKTLIFGLAANVFDVYSDIGTGLHHLQQKVVTRKVKENWSCLPYKAVTTVKVRKCFNNLCHTNKTKSSFDGYHCQEQDIRWATVTFSFIQMPSVLIFICFTVGLYLYEDCHAKYYLALLLLLVVPFPVVVFAQQILSIFLNTEQMEVYSAIFLFGEGCLEASPQLLTLLYIIIGDSEREVAWIQKASVVSSILTITKTSVELFAVESYSFGEDFISHKFSNNDSLLKDHGLAGKMWTLLKLSPVFLLSLFYKVGMFAVITTLLKIYSAPYIVTGIIFTFTVAFFKQPRSDVFGSRVAIAIFYSITNIAITSKCPLRNRKENYAVMLIVSKMWVLMHSFMLLILLTLVALSPEHLPGIYHMFPHWKNVHRLGLISDKPRFFGICGILLALGPLSLISLIWLKSQVKGLEREGGRKFWEVDWCTNTISRTTVIKEVVSAVTVEPFAQVSLNPVYVQSPDASHKMK